MSTISTIITTAVTLASSGSYTSPLTITATGEVRNNNTQYAIYAPAGIAKPVISNAGQIIDTKGAGIYVKKSGTISNSASALISGGDYGIYTGNTKLSTITNQGTIRATSITGTGIFLEGGGSISNFGTITGGTGTSSAGIEIGGSGTIDNLGSSALISGGAYGIYVTSASAAIIINQGTISATRAAGYGIYLQNGTITNAGTISGAKAAVDFAGAQNSELIIDPGAVFTGNVIASTASSSTLYLAAGPSPGTLSGLGIKYQGFSNISIATGSNWAIAGANSFATGTLTDSGTLTIGTGATLSGKATGTLATAGILLNLGTINGLAAAVAKTGTLTNAGLIQGASPTAISLAGGYLLNQTAGLIAGTTAGIAAAAGNINNQGNIRATGTGVELSGSATLINIGTLSGGTKYAGLGLAGGYVRNSGSTAFITGGAYGISSTGPLSVTIINQGSITATRAGGYGIYLAGGGTVTNAGTISGAKSAVEFAGAQNAELIFDAGAVFAGNIVANSAAYDLLVLAAGAPGTISGLGTQYQNFSKIQIATGANWTLSGNNSLTLAETLQNTGTLAITGRGSFTNGGLIINTTAGLAAIDGSFTNSGEITGGSFAAIAFTDTGGNESPTDSLLNAGTIIGGTGGIGLDIITENFAHATFANTGIIIAGSLGGIGLKDQALPFINSGTIEGGTGTGVYLNVLQANFVNAGLVTASSGTAARAEAAATINNNSLIESQSGIAADVSNGGNLINTGTVIAVAGSIAVNEGSGNVTNTGLISGGTSFGITGGNLVNSGAVIAGVGGTAVQLGVEAVLNNTGNLIGGSDGGIGLISNPDFYHFTITNAGTIRGGAGGAAGGGTAVDDQSGVFANTGIIIGGTGSTIGSGDAGGTGALIAPTYGALINSGTITGGAGGTLSPGNYGQGGAGVSLSTYGYGTNFGLIIGGAHGGAGLVSSSVFDFTNAGTISSTGSYGVDITGARHYLLGTISGGTFTNAGLISGAKYAILFNNGTYKNTPDTARLIVDPGARFQGLVTSQDTLSTLELNTGSTVGTITSLGTQFTGFTTLQIDTAAQWRATGGNSFAGSVIDNGTLEIASAASLNITGTLTGSGIADIDANARLAVTGPISSAETINFQGSNAVLQLGQAPVAQNIFHGFTIGDTIDLAFATAINSADLIAGNLLVVAAANPANNITIALDPSANYSNDVFNTSTDSATGGTDITVVVTPPPTTYIWAGATSAPFAAAPSWQGDSGYPRARDTALFNLSAAGPYTVTGNATIANLIIDDNVTLTGKINASNGGTIGSTGSTAGTLTVSGSLVSPTLTLQNSRTVLDILSGATVDAVGSVIDAGTVAIAAGGLLVTPTITLQNSQSLLNIASGATLAGAILSNAGGTIAAAGTVTGTLQITGTTSATLEISSTTFLAGNVTASSSASDILELTGSAATIFSGLGTQFSNFETLAFAPGANWTVVEPYQSIDTLSEITGFTTGTTIILEGFAEAKTAGGSNGSKYVPGVGLELSNGFQQIIIPIGQDPSIIEPATYSPHGNTTLIGGIDHITNFTPLNVTLGNFIFASGVTITPTGTVAPASGVGVTFGYNQTLLNSGTIFAANGAYGVSDNQSAFSNTGIVIGGTSAAVSLRTGPHFPFNLTSYFYNSGLVQGAPGITLGNGTIQPGGNGFYGGYNTASDMFINGKSGTIIGGALNGNGVTLNRAVYFQNLGTIIAGSGSGDGFIGSAETFLNQGVIAASAGIGLYLAGYTNSFFNTGLIESNTGTAFESKFNGVNNGTIKALGGSIAAYQRNSYLRNNGLIAGGTSTALLDRGNVNNAGTIIGAIGGNAVSLNFGNLINSGLLIGGSAGAAAVLSSAELGGNFLTNSGEIFGGTGAAGGTFGGAGGDGVILTSEPSFFNTGTIIGGTGGYAATGTAGTGGVGLYTSAFGSIINAGTIIGGAGGTMAMGGTGVLVSGLAARFTNQGTVIAGAGAYGVVILNNADATNSGTIQAASNYGVLFTGGTRFFQEAGTLITSGLISGQKDAVLFNNSLNNDVLIVDPGARFSGLVVGSTLSSDILEFGAGASITGIGTEFLNFNSLSFATGSAVIEGNSLGLAHGQTISGFTTGSTIILDNFVVNTLATTYVSGIGLELTSTLGTHVTLDIAGTFTTKNFLAVDPPGDTTITYQAAACFAAGTRILTTNGEVPVEDLSIGDQLFTTTGTAPIIWIGQRRLNLKAHPRPESVQPILVQAGALSHGAPNRDLILSPDHALYLNGHLIPAKSLLNGVSIRQLHRASVRYFHIELPAHAILFAQNVPAESYLESGNRAAFENTGPVLTLHPDFAQTIREQTSCAPFAEHGPAVEAARQSILDRAGIATTTDPALTITHKNGAAIIKSRAAIPGDIFADPRDRRRLGVKIASLTINGRHIPLDHPGLAQGWHAPEPDGRWTNGHAVIPASLLKGGKAINIQLAATLAYPLPEREKSSLLTH